MVLALYCEYCSSWWSCFLSNSVAAETGAWNYIIKEPQQTLQLTKVQLSDQNKNLVSKRVLLQQHFDWFLSTQAKAKIIVC